MPKSYVQRINEIMEQLNSTADNIEDRDSVSEQQQERADAYHAAADGLQQAIDELVSLD